MNIPAFPVEDPFQTHQISSWPYKHLHSSCFCTHYSIFFFSYFTVTLLCCVNSTTNEWQSLSLSSGNYFFLRSFARHPLQYITHKQPLTVYSQWKSTVSRGQCLPHFCRCSPFSHVEYVHFKICFELLMCSEFRLFKIPQISLYFSWLRMSHRKGRLLCTDLLLYLIVVLHS